MASDTASPDRRSPLSRGALERQRSHIFAAIGHELRTPLSSIRGYLETLLEGKTDEITARRFLKTAHRETLRMTRMLDGMFAFSLLDLSAIGACDASSDVAEQIARACEIVAPLAASRRITIECLSPCHPEPVEGRHWAAIDPDACLQLIVNLLENAVKYGRSGGKVRIEMRAISEGVLVVVDDDGPGIAPADYESIFELRRRGTETASRPGAGIGLAIVKMISERAGGSVRCCASGLGGAQFEVMLPARDPPG